MLLYRLFYYNVFFLLSTFSFASDLRSLTGLKTHKTIILSMHDNPWESQTVEQIRQYPGFLGEKSALTTVHLKREFLTDWAHMGDVFKDYDDIKKIIVACHDEGLLALERNTLKEFIQTFQHAYREDCLRFVISIPEGSTESHKNDIMKRFAGLYFEVFISFIERSYM